MKLVFLDASTIDRADLDFAPLRTFGNLTLHQVTSPEKVGDRIADADIVITNKALVSREALAKAPKVRLVVSAATGVNQIDLEACKERGITVCNVAGYSTEAVAQHTFALLLNLVTAVDRYSASITQDWPASPIFTRLDHPVTELAGKTLGIVGFGTIGQAVARIGAAFGMKVVAYSRSEASPDAAVPRIAGEEFFSSCDVISLHCPLTAQTERFINRISLALMKPDSLLINTGRGALVDEHALADALRHGEIGGAALDVLTVEPPPKNHPLLATDLPNLLITPHTAWTSREARQRLLAGVIADIQGFLDGHPIHHIV